MPPLAVVHVPLYTRCATPHLCSYEQKVKEAALAYFILWRKRTKSMSDLDFQCELFLNSTSNDVDFEVEVRCCVASIIRHRAPPACFPVHPVMNAPLHYTIRLPVLPPRPSNR